MDQVRQEILSIAPNAGAMADDHAINAWLLAWRGEMIQETALVCMDQLSLDMVANLAEQSVEIMATDGLMDYDTATFTAEAFRAQQVYLEAEGDDYDPVPREPYGNLAGQCRTGGVREDPYKRLSLIEATYRMLLARLPIGDYRQEHGRLKNDLLECLKDGMSMDDPDRETLEWYRANQWL